MHNDDSGPYNRCRINKERLDKLNDILTSLDDSYWCDFDDCEHELKALKFNRYFPAIRAKLLFQRIIPCETNADHLQHISGPAPGYNDLEAKAFMCGSDVVSEVSSLRMLEQQTGRTLKSILRAASEDIPLCKEETDAIVANVGMMYTPALRALASKVGGIAADAEPGTHERWPTLQHISI